MFEEGEIGGCGSWFGGFCCQYFLFQDGSGGSVVSIYFSSGKICGFSF